jgi:hypothetical protein
VADNTWENKWNQSADLTVPTNKNIIYIYPNDDKAWDNAEGYWISISDYLLSLE